MLLDVLTGELVGYGQFEAVILVAEEAGPAGPVRERLRRQVVLERRKKTIPQSVRHGSDSYTAELQTHLSTTVDNSEARALDGETPPKTTCPRPVSRAGGPVPEAGPRPAC